MDVARLAAAVAATDCAARAADAPRVSSAIAGRGSDADITTAGFPTADVAEIPTAAAASRITAISALSSSISALARALAAAYPAPALAADDTNVPTTPTALFAHA